MGNKLKILIILVITIILVGWGEYIIPTKLEISDVQVVEVIGIDSAENNNVSFSAVFSPHKGEKEENSGEKKEKILTVTAPSFVDCIRGVQNYEDKILLGSHVKSIIIGENLAKEKLIQGIEYITKDPELRLNSNIYIAKEMDAKELFEEGVGNNYLFTGRIDNLTLSKKGFKNKHAFDIIDIIRILLSDQEIGLVPCIQIVKNGDKQLENYTITTSKEEKNRVELAGYGLIKGGKLIGYLGYPETTGFNYISNRVLGANIKLLNNDEIIGVSQTSSRSNISYKFSGDNLEKVIIKINTENSLIETSSGRNIFANDIKPIEELENNYIKDLVESCVRYAKNMNTDFLGIGEKLQLSHPYKWRKIKERWEEIFVTVPIEVEVDSKINEQYGILSTIGNR